MQRFLERLYEVDLRRITIDEHHHRDLAVDAVSTRYHHPRQLGRLESGCICLLSMGT